MDFSFLAQEEDVEGIVKLVIFLVVLVVFVFKRIFAAFTGQDADGDDERVYPKRNYHSEDASDDAADTDGDELAEWFDDSRPRRAVKESGDVPVLVKKTRAAVKKYASPKKTVARTVVSEPVDLNYDEEAVRQMLERRTPLAERIKAKSSAPSREKISPNPASETTGWGAKIFSSHDSVVRAVVASEILGKPRAFESDFDNF